MKLRERLKKRLDRPRAIWWAVALGVLLTLPALGTGWLMDDHAIRAMLSSDGPNFMSRGPHELYRFVLDDPGWRGEATDAGWLPWYADNELQIELMRPLSSLTLSLDHALWPGSPALAHAQSILWYAALVLIVALLFRRLISTPWIAALAAILYAVDEAHGFPVAWWCNRHAVISMVFAALALLAHVMWRQDGRRGAAIAAPICLGFGLLASETALSITAYLFAYALFLDRGSFGRRALTLLPCAAVSIIWRAFYSALGYGTSGSSLMLDPVWEPLHYLVAVGERLPLLIQGQLTPLMPDLSMLFTGTAVTVLMVVTLAVLALMTAALWHLVRRDRLVRFWVAGMLISALPACATFASDRMLLAVGIGGMGLVAQVIARHSEVELEAYWTRRSVKILSVVFIVFHLVLSPLLLPARALQPQTMAASTDDAFRSLDRLGDLRGKTVVIVTAPQFNYATYTLFTRQELGLSTPDRATAVATGLNATTVTRVDDHTLQLASEEGFMTAALDRVFCHPDHQFEAGRTVSLSGLSIQVTRVSDSGDPIEIECTFEHSLNDPSLLFTAWSAEGYVPFELPPLGENVEIPAVNPAELATFQYEAPANR